MLESIQKNVTWRAVLIAAIAAGTVFMAVNIVLTTLFFQISPALLVRYTASLVMGSGVLTDTSALPLVIGMGVHYGLSLLLTLVITIVIHRWGLLMGVVGGGILGIAIYFIDLYALTTFFPWFFAINNTALFLSHVLFGMVAGGVYELFDHFDLPFLAQEKVT